MEKSEILKKSFEKAKNGGWKEDCWYDWSQYAWEDYADNAEHIMFIFRHDFAQAFWNNEYYRLCSEAVDTLITQQGKDVYKYLAGIYIPSWKYHLQQMVLDPAPINYLEKFI